MAANAAEVERVAGEVKTAANAQRTEVAKQIASDLSVAARAKLPPGVKIVTLDNGVLVIATPDPL